MTDKIKWDIRVDPDLPPDTIYIGAEIPTTQYTLSDGRIIIQQEFDPKKGVFMKVDKDER